MSGELFNGGGLSAYPPPNPMFSGTTATTTTTTKSEGQSKKKESGGNNVNKELHMFVWSSSASPASEGNLKHAVNKAVSTDFAAVERGEEYIICI